MKTLCIYSTRTGISKQIVDKISEIIEMETLELSDGKTYKGFLGYVAAAVVGLRKTLPTLLPYKTNLPIEDYDKIIVVAPIWCEDISPFVRTFLADNKEHIKCDVYVVANHMSDLPYDKKIHELSQSIGKEIKAFATVQTKNHDWTEEIEAFCKMILL